MGIPEKRILSWTKISSMASPSICGAGGRSELMLSERAIEGERERFRVGGGEREAGHVPESRGGFKPSISTAAQIGGGTDQKERAFCLPQQQPLCPGRGWQRQSRSTFSDPSPRGQVPVSVCADALPAPFDGSHREPADKGKLLALCCDRKRVAAHTTNT